MAKNTAIGWTHRPGTEGGTWNPWQGCVKKSPGCDNCYMYREKIRYGQDPATVVRSNDRTFKMPLRLDEPHTLFTCSWTDFFNPEADGWRDEAWSIMQRTPQHTYLVLTKLHTRIITHLPSDWERHGPGYPNVWLGVSAENQTWADNRIPFLLRVPAVVHFISAEPLLGPITLKPEWLTGQYGKMVHRAEWAARLDWVISGGESGPGARPMDLAWVRTLRDECRAAGVAFFHKQNGDATVGRQIGVHHGGSEIDGEQYQAFPVPQFSA